MEANSLRQLRKKQLLLINIAFGSMFLIIAVVAIFEIQLFYFTLFSLVLLLVSLVEQVTNSSLLHKWFPFMKEIEKYEREKLGVTEYKQQKRAIVISHFVLIVLLMIQLGPMQNESAMNFPIAVIILITLLILGVLINIVHFLRVRRIDNSSTQEDLKGYTLKSLAVQIGLGVTIGFLFIVGTIAWVIHSISQW